MANILEKILGKEKIPETDINKLKKETSKLYSKMIDSLYEKYVKEK